MGQLPSRKPVSVSARQRRVLAKLLGGDTGKCTTNALDGLHRRGWVSAAGAGYQLTESGRHLAELSERTGGRGDLSLD
jgi:hypothetical protein